MLTQASLRGTVQPVVSIFIQKAMYGFNEKVEVIAEQRQISPLGPEADQAALEQRIADVVIDDLEDN